ncbi:MAG: acetate--CoA ligase family protein [Burkholderiales bacterium]
MNQAADLSHLARGPKCVAKVMKPKSVAIVGMSARAGSAGQNVLNGLKANNFKGDIYLIGRSDEPIDGRKVLKTVEEIPEGVDLAVFTLPAAGVPEAVDSCVKRKVGAALIFAAGFAESGHSDVQAQVTKVARAGGLGLVGPNCLGYTNNVEGFSLHMLFAGAAKTWKTGDKPCIAFIGQSGGMLGHMQRSAEARRLSISYVVTTGNEAGLEMTDFLEYAIEDEATKVIVLYSEQIRRPQAFLAACEKARAAKKPVLLLHPGRGAKAQAATASHTGSLVGDHASMHAFASDAGVAVFDMLDELMDTVEMVARYPEVSAKGPAVLTASGAFVALINDFSETIGLEFPELTPETMEKLRAKLPSFGAPNNPLDTTAGGAPGANVDLTRYLLEDPNIGCLFISYPIAGPKGVQVIGEFVKGMEGNKKPVVVVALGDGSALTPELQAAADNGPFMFSRSSDRCLRAIGHYTRYGRLLARAKGNVNPAPYAGLPKLGSGTQPEWLGKKVFEKMGIRVPAGDLAKSADDAVAVAKRIGYPVAMKAQAAALSHKTEAGGVLLNIKDEAGVRAAWDTLKQNIARAAPGVMLDGVLVEVMSPKGLELMVGAKRDPAWGPVVLFGLGGIWVEALGDVRVLTASASEKTILEELTKLRTAKLLNGFRGQPAVDVEAVARTVTQIGRLMLTEPSIIEVDVNPLIALPKGQGVLALDALIVTG